MPGPKPITVPPETLKAMADAYARGVPAFRVAFRFGISEPTLRRLFREAGIVLRPPRGKDRADG